MNNDSVELIDQIIGIYNKDYVESKNNRIASLEKQIADMTAERLRTPGAYYVVPKEVMDAKDARIKELEVMVAAKPVPIVYDCTTDALLVGQREHEIAVLKNEIAELKARLNAAKSLNTKEKRLLNETGKYDKCGVGGISIDAATGAAELAESMLDDGRSLSYAAACLLVLHRTFAAAQAKNREVLDLNKHLVKKFEDMLAVKR